MLRIARLVVKGEPAVYHVISRTALEFLMAGASAIQVGTANFVDPGVSLKIIEGLKKFCEDQGIRSIEEIIGSLQIE